jgi:hypothetical protein
MSFIDEQVLDDEDVVTIASPCCALVPVAPSLYRARKRATPRPNLTFVAQLIASAEQLPQARNLRRAAPADAINAYRSGQRSVVGAGVRTRQII